MVEEYKSQDGILLVDKAPDWTSHDVVKFIRRFGIKKVGHCGTLDPQATGLLVIVTGRATKLSQRLSGEEKEYFATLELGKETDSQDAEGEVTAEADWSGVTEEQVREVMMGFIGDQMQVPPMVSALKRDGKKLYELARQGIVVEREPRPMTIHELEILEVALPHVKFRARCSKGTYIRTLCADIGTKLGCGGHMKELRRSGSGRFRIENATPMDDIKTWNRDDLLDHLITLEQLLADL